MKFVDMGAWYAAYIRSDPAHELVAPLVDGSNELLVTSDFVLAEALNLLQARGESRRAQILGQRLLEGSAINLIHVTAADLEKAFVFFSAKPDRPWSFTDCTSLAVMQRMGIKTAISLDHHFCQMPGIQVEP